MTTPQIAELMERHQAESFRARDREWAVREGLFVTEIEDGDWLVVDQHLDTIDHAYSAAEVEDLLGLLLARRSQIQPPR